ncbi:Alpha/Beta hydrolase protein [Mycena floridula]|nr:Alpha/Beta hydrolase protein [Mycena floridula]
MDTSLYKDTVTPRGIKYHYFYSPAAPDKPTVIFLHGFPSTSSDWRHQVPFFVNEGYGVVVPDLLGYGGTDKPTDAALYLKSLVVNDIIAILDAEGLQQVIAVGHDWGSSVVSGLANYYPNRFLGFAFLDVGYMAPRPEGNIDIIRERSEAFVGYDNTGYWLFFAEDGADKIIEDHIDSFLDIFYPAEPKAWITDMGPKGTVKNYILKDAKPVLPKYLTQDDLNKMKAELLKNGLAGPLCWYRQLVSNHSFKDDEGVPKENYKIIQPVFFAACLQDYIAIPKVQSLSITALCPNSTVKEYDTDHWVQLAAPEEVNRDLLAWMKSF